MLVGSGHLQGAAALGRGTLLLTPQGLGQRLQPSDTDIRLGVRVQAVEHEAGNQFVRPLVTWSPEHKRPVFFVASALMFGTVGSVYAFNRASLSLWHLMVFLGSTWCTCYFDDFSGIEATKSAKSSRAFMEGLLKVLGWKFAEQGKKAKPHAPVFDALGVTLDLTACRKGSIKVYNKKSRVADLKLDASRILDKGEIRKAEASSLHGRLNFAQGQMFGCLLKPAMQALSSWAEGHQQASKDRLAQVMVYVATFLVHAPPQVVSIHDRRPPALLFTDGAYEPDGQG